METAEQFYKGVTTSKNNQHRADAKRNSCGKKKKGGGSTSPSNTKKVRADKHQSNYVDRMSDASNGGITCMFHGPGNYTEECKVLRDYSKRKTGTTDSQVKLKKFQR